MTSVEPARGSLEREVKFEADLAFVLPDLGEVVGQIVRERDLDICTAYFDTAGFRLWRRGITLRHRTGEESGTGIWTVKLPAHGDGPTLDRTELTWMDRRESLPEEVTSLLRGITRSSPLREIVELVTRRRRLSLHDSAGMPLAELDDDTVTVRGGARDGVRFRQIELELGPGGDALVGPVRKRLSHAGARPGGGQKLAKAVDLPAQESEVPGHGHMGASVGDLVRTSIAAALDRLLDHDYALRIDPSDPSIEGVHQARVATRRLRSDLKLFRSLLDPDWVSHVRTELKRLGEILGNVRDADVLAMMLGGEGDSSPFEAEGRRALWARLTEQRRSDCAELAGVLAGHRYLTLLDQLEAAAQRRPFGESTRGDGAWAPPSLASRPATSVLPALVRHRWRSLRREVRKAGRHPTDPELHAMRIRAKELRYAAELAAPVFGNPARRTAVAAEQVQNVLGDHHDAVTAETWLRRQAMEGTPAASYSAGRLAAEQTRVQRRLRRRWRSVFRDLDRKKCRRWF